MNVLVYYFVFQFTEENILLRTPENYDHHCDLVEGPYGKEDSITYGINYRSSLNTIKGFHVANSQLPQDIMHILLEGVLPLELKLLLSVLTCTKKLFSLTFINDCIKNFMYGSSEIKNKPPKFLESKHILPASKFPLSGQ